MSSGDSLRGVHIYPRKSVKPPFTLPVPGVDPVEGETIPRRHKKSINALATVPEAGINTLYDLIVNSARKYGDANALGSRKIIDTHVETKKIKKIVDGREEYVSKEWKYFELSGYSYMSYKEYLKLALELGSGLRKLGLQPKTDKVHIYAATRCVCYQVGA
jgi:long-chain acyl-CoA synthetase